MTQFEQMLLNKGYIKHILNCKTMKYELARGHNISTLVNLDHRYFHRDDKIILQKISNTSNSFLVRFMGVFFKLRVFVSRE